MEENFWAWWRGQRWGDKTRSQYVAQVGFELAEVLLLPSARIYRQESLCPVKSAVLASIILCHCSKNKDLLVILDL